MPCKVEPLLLLVTLEEILFPEAATVQAAPYAALAAAPSMTDGVMLNSHEAAAFPQADDGDVPWMARGAYEMVAGESVPRIAPRPAVAVGVQAAGAVAVDGGGGTSIVLRPSPPHYLGCLLSLACISNRTGRTAEHRSKHTSRKRIGKGHDKKGGCCDQY